VAFAEGAAGEREEARSEAQQSCLRVSRFFTPEFFVDPYPTYDELRREPVHWDDELEGWVLTGYAEVAAALGDPRVSRGGGPREGDLLTRLLTRMMLFTDPPDHTRLRALANRAFTPRRIEALRPRIAATVDELLARVEEEEWDLIEGLAYPLPVIVIAEILGLPADDRVLFKRWSDDVIAYAARGGDDPELRERALRSARELAEYFAGLVAELRAHPSDTLMSALVEAEEGHTRLTEEELLANAILLLMNGHETTTFAIGNGMLALLRHPNELARLREDPGLIAGAVEEILRYDGSIQMRGVSAREDLELDATEIRAGQDLWLAIGATGRDPRQFPEPNRFDLGRSANKHLQFGHGPHFCIAAALARAEMALALAGLLARFRRIERAADETEWHQIAVFRGPKALPLAVRR
jgi:pimeloyl-[acyl-carrier protein] synthase